MIHSVAQASRLCVHRRDGGATECVLPQSELDIPWSRASWCCQRHHVAVRHVFEGRNSEEKHAGSHIGDEAFIRPPGGGDREQGALLVVDA